MKRFNFSVRVVSVLMGVCLFTSLLLAACSQGASPSPSPSAPSSPAPPVSSPTSPATSPPPTAVPEETPQSGGILNIGEDVAPVGLDPHRTRALASFLAFEHVYDPLLEFDTELGLRPALAERWEMVDDVTYIFYLRQGVKFHNGREMVADDVKYSLERLLNPGEGFVSRIGEYAGMTVEVVDEYTVKVTLPRPNAPFILQIASEGAAIVPQEVVENNGGSLDEVMVGTGPFKFVRYTPDTSLELERNEDYWRPGLPYLDGLFIKYIPDEAARVAALRAGDIDLAILRDSSSALVLRGDANTTLIERPGTDRALIFFNTRNAPFDDVRVRQAISCAIDRKAIVDTVLLGEGEPSGALPPGDWFAIPTDDMLCYEPDIEEAKQLLTDAGYADGFTVQIITTPQYPKTVEYATVVMDQLAAIGINLEIQNLEFGNLVTKLGERDFEMLAIIWAGLVGPDKMLYLYHTDHRQDYTGVNDAQLDQWLDDAQVTFDRDEQREIYTQVQTRLVELNPALWLYVDRRFIGTSNTVRGFIPMDNSSKITITETWLSSQ